MATDRRADASSGDIEDRPSTHYSLTVPLSPTLKAVYEGLTADELTGLLNVAAGEAPALGASQLPKFLAFSGGSWSPYVPLARGFSEPLNPADIAGIHAIGFPSIFGAESVSSQSSAGAAVGDAVLSAGVAAARSGALRPLPTLSQLNTRLSAAPIRRSLTELHQLAEPMPTDIDPRLQLAILNRRTGKVGAAISSAAADEVPVIARVTSFEDWEALPDVHPGAELGAGEDGSVLVTGRIPLDRVEAVRNAGPVISLKASQPVQPALAKTIETMGVRQDLLPPGISPSGGKGVVVGVVDTGGDFAHLNFRHQDGTTRLLALWHQSGVATPSSPFGYGRLFTRSEIDAALTTSDPYLTLGYGPRPDNAQQQGTHGTHVMDIAAGNGLGSTIPGVAPEADLVFVEMAATDIAWSGPDSVHQSFGDSAQVLEAIKFIFDTAGDRPCVVNLSLGTNGGPHDGTSLVEQGIDALVNAKPNRAVVIAAANSQLDGIHTQGTVPAAATLDVGWHLVDEAGGEFELWYPGADRLEVTLIGPDGTLLGTVASGSNLPIASGATPVIFISNRLNDPNNQCNVIGIWLAENLPGGTWTVRLRSLSEQPIDFHAWIERMDGAQASFVNPVFTHTLGSISTGRKTLVVGSYDAHKPQLPLSSFSSCGPTRDGRQKPELSAPGGNVFAARSRTRTGVVRKSGTSMAAPAVTGLIALVLGEAARQGKNLDCDALRAKLMTMTDRAPPAEAAGTWDPRYGFGRASAKAI